MWHTVGADPFLAGVAAAQTVQGMQSTGVMANAKVSLPMVLSTNRR
jgi:beta-glucosidase-like glycosyl hydrolase